MPNLKDRLEKLKSKKTKRITGVTNMDGLTEDSTTKLNADNSFIDFLIGGAFLVVAFIFGRKK